MTSLRALRDLFNFSQTELALLLGRSMSTVSRLEHGKEPSEGDRAVLLALEQTAKSKRPPKLKRILHQRGRVAALRALSPD